MVYKEDPEKRSVIHIDGNPLNNDIKNLRRAKNNEVAKSRELNSSYTSRIGGKSKQLPNLELLNEYFYYDYQKKQLCNKILRSYKARKDEISGHFDNKGYRTVSIHSIHYLTHRLIWFMIYKEDPKDLQIDHIDGNPANNDIKNLRLVTNQENSQNQKLNANNTSGTPGVHWSKTTRKWIARIKINQERKNLGSFAKKEDAKKARKEAEIKYGFHKNHGRKNNE